MSRSLAVERNCFAGKVGIRKESTPALGDDRGSRHSSEEDQTVQELKGGSKIVQEWPLKVSIAEAHAK